MRAGESPLQVSADTGWPIERVERYAEQPLAERAFIAEQALSVEIRRSGSSVTVRDTAVDALARAGVDLGDLVVDSARRADGKWIVTAEVPGRSISGEWVYDHGARSLQPVDEGARRLMGVEPAAQVAVAEVPGVGAESAAAETLETRPRLVAVPDAANDPEALPSGDDLAEEFDLAADADVPGESSPGTTPGGHETLALPLPSAAQAPSERPASPPKAKPRSKGRRASVPSWDEILFGTSTHDAD